LTQGLSTAPYSNVYSQTMNVGSTTVSQGNYTMTVTQPQSNTGTGYGIQVGTPSVPNNVVIGNQFSDTGLVYVSNQGGGGDTFVGYGDSFIAPRSGGLIVGTSTAGLSGNGGLYVQNSITAAKASGFSGYIVCYATGGALGHMTQAALLAGGGSATCTAN
jgi:hypothetical protein